VKLDLVTDALGKEYRFESGSSVTGSRVRKYNLYYLVSQSDMVLYLANINLVQDRKEAIYTLHRITIAVVFSL
jgi:hypothetical protein